MTKLLPLSRGLFTLVDDDDFASLNQYKWYAATGNYAYRTVKTDGQRTNISLSRTILGVGANQLVDHINGDNLDNRRCNLRPATTAQNTANQVNLQSTNTSGYRGVTKTSANRWTAMVSVEGKRVRLGCFASPVDAAKAYDRAAVDIYGEFARPNYVEASR